MQEHSLEWLLEERVDDKEEEEGKEAWKGRGGGREKGLPEIGGRRECSYLRESEAGSNDVGPQGACQVVGAVEDPCQKARAHQTAQQLCD